jgi:predicted O-linked N-acetylglucosamine transferase (SPINDLY family)
VGFISRHISRHSVTRCYGGIIRGVAERSDWEVFLLSTSGARTDEVSAGLAGAATGGHVQLPDDLSQARSRIAQLRLDALVYLDIGMEVFTLLLAHARLAPVQCVMTGHPVTTGIRNVDHFLSWDLAEPPDAESHYSERLVRLKHGGVCFEEPTLPPSPKSRKALGLPTEGRLCACPVSLIKIHPDLDAAIAEILSRDPEAVILFFQNPQRPTWHGLLQTRMNRTVPPECQDRLLFLPWINSAEDFLSMLMAVDLVLDPFHFGAHSTATQVYAAGTPLVTLEGEFLRGRVGAAFNRVVGIPECTAQSVEEYVEIALRLLSDPAFQGDVRRKIEVQKNLLFKQEGAADEMVEFLQRILNP